MTKTVDVTTEELFSAAQEYQVRELCFSICVNMIANAVGRCEVRTFRENQEVFDREYYMWNVEPNANQNATAFMHKLITNLCQSNEALVIEARKRDGYSAIAVADDWEEPEAWVSRQNEYRGVMVGDTKYDKVFRESDVIHLRLNHANIVPVIKGMYDAYWRLASAAMRAYQWEKGQHWKVHVDQANQGDDDWAKAFQKMIEDQVRPFVKSNGAILPEFNGYKYENVGSRPGVQSSGDTRDIKSLIEDIFEFTARAFLIPAVLVNGKIEGTKDANTRFLTNCVDPICDQLQDEINRKRYGFEEWSRGNFVRVDSSSIIHYDLFANAANVEKLVGSGAYSINDVLRASNQPTIKEPWADKHWLTLNISNIEQAARPFEAREGGEDE